MPRYRLTIEYDGRPYCGYQAQGKLPPTPVRLTAEDWQASITRAWTHAAGEETKESSGEVFAESVATVLDISTYNS